MTTAQEKNDGFRKPLTPEEINNLVRKVNAGTVAVIKRKPNKCRVCGEPMRNWRYIGDIDAVAEWKVTCDCGVEGYS